MKKRTGFTLVELLAVIVILAIILAIAVPSVSNIIDKTNKAAFKSSVLMVLDQGRLYQLTSNIGPGKTLGELGLTSIGNLNSNGAIKEENSVLLTSSPAITNGKYCVVEDTSKSDLLNNQTANIKIYACKTNPRQNEVACDICDVDITGPENVVATIGTVTSKSIEVIGSATDVESRIVGYAFSKDNGVTWTATQTSNVYVFNDLSNGTYQIKVRAYNSIDMTTDSAVVNQSTVSILTPTYSISVTGWATDKIVTIDYQTTDYEKQYSIDGGSTWITSTNQTQDVAFHTNGNVIARTTDGINEVTSSTYNVTQIDTTEPESAAATVGTVTSSSIEVIGSGTDAESGIIQYAFSKDNGSTWTTPQTGTTYTFTGLTSGTYPIKVRVYNAVNLTLDSNAVSQLTTGISAPTYSAVPVLGWATSKTITIDYQTTSYTKQYSIDGGSTWTTSSNQMQDVVFNAAGSVIARVTDGVNTITAATYNVTQIDTTAPTLATAIIGTVASDSIQVTGSGTDVESGIVQYAFSKDNGSTWTTPQAGATYTFTGLTTGTYHIRVKVYNGSSLTLVSNTVSQLTTGISMPTYSVSPSSGWATSKTVTIDYQTTSYTKQYSIDGGSTWNTSSTQTKDITFNAAGSVIARVTDGVNTITSVTYNVTQIDTTAPTGLSVGIGIVTTNSIQVTANGTDTESGIVNYQFSNDNGSSWTTVQASNTYTFSNLAIGTYQIEVKLINNAGLSTISSAMAQATVSINAPTYSISPSSGWATSKTVTINYQTSSYTKQYSIDGGSTWPTSSNQTQDVVFNAAGSVIARVTDGVNTITAATYNVTQIDTTAPTVSALDGGKTATSVTVLASASDSGSGINGSTYQYSSDNGSTWTSQTSATSYTFTGLLPSATYQFRVRASDNAGNSTTSSAVSITASTLTTITFNYTNNYQTWTVPTTGTYKLEVLGAQGGAPATGAGLGGYSYGNINLTAGQIIYIYVGGQGAAGDQGYLAYGGFNGGGNGGVSVDSGSWRYGAAGGGASDIRIGGQGLANRVIVAGGGGGSGGGGATYGGPGGAGGGTTGTTGGREPYSPSINPGAGGTQASGGAGGTSGYGANGAPGSLGQGGSGYYYLTTTNNNPGGGGGGGGGYYGGGAGGNDGGYGAGAGGGGGSSYTGGLSSSGTTSGVQYGNGNIKITGPFTGTLPTQATFYYTGNVQTWTAPSTATYRLESWGSQGGNGNLESGLGGYSYGNINLTAGQLLYIYVGGYSSNYSIYQAGGYNGGGNGGVAVDSGSWRYGTGGGGASDIRMGGTALANRIIVAGGGGGSGSGGSTYAGVGGGGGGTTGVTGGREPYSPGINPGTGGTQAAGGTGGSGGGNGSLGQGGAGYNYSQTTYNNPGGGGGGGGGYYGGGAGGNDSGYGAGAGGGGGSSYTGSLTNAGTTSSVQGSYGMVRITGP